MAAWRRRGKSALPFKSTRHPPLAPNRSLAAGLLSLVTSQSSSVSATLSVCTLTRYDYYVCYTVSCTLTLYDYFVRYTVSCILTRYDYFVRYTVRLSAHSIRLLCPPHCQVVRSLDTVTVSATMPVCTLTRYDYFVRYTASLYSHSIRLLCPLHCQFVRSLNTITVSAALSVCTPTRYDYCFL